MKLRFGMKTGALVITVLAVVLAFVFAPHSMEVHDQQGTLVCRRIVKRNYKLELLHHGSETWYYPSGVPMYERGIWGKPVFEDITSLSPVTGHFPLVMEAISPHTSQLLHWQFGKAKYWLPDGKRCSREQFHARYPFAWRGR